MQNSDITPEINHTQEKINSSSIIVGLIDSMLEKNTPLFHILMYAKNLDPEQLLYIYKIKLNSYKAYTSAHNLMLLQDEDDEISSVNMASYNAEYFLKGVVRQTLKLFNANDINITLNCKSGCRSVLFDLRRTSLILFNLISNSAIHTNKKQKNILITTEKHGSDFVITFSDDGQGIPKNKIDSLFESYKIKPDKTRLIETGGMYISGLGLAVSRKVARDMQGELSYIPTKTGAKFELVIPQLKHHDRISETIEKAPDLEFAEKYLASAIMYIKYNE